MNDGHKAKHSVSGQSATDCKTKTALKRTDSQISGFKRCLVSKCVGMAPCRDKVERPTKTGEQRFEMYKWWVQISMRLLWRNLLMMDPEITYQHWTKQRLLTAEEVVFLLNLRC